MSRSSHWSHTFGPPNQNPVNTSPLPMCATCPTYLILLDLITLTVFNEEYSLLSSLCSFLHDLSSSLLGTNILLNPVFSKTLSSSLKVRDQVSHAGSTTGKITVLCILIFRFFDMRWGDKRFWTE